MPCIHFDRYFDLTHNISRFTYRMSTIKLFYKLKTVSTYSVCLSNRTTCVFAYIYSALIFQRATLKNMERPGYEAIEYIIITIIIIASHAVAIYSKNKSEHDG